MPCQPMPAQPGPPRTHPPRAAPTPRHRSRNNDPPHTRSGTRSLYNEHTFLPNSDEYADARQRAANRPTNPHPPLRRIAAHEDVPTFPPLAAPHHRRITTTPPPRNLVKAEVDDARLEPNRAGQHPRQCDHGSPPRRQRAADLAAPHTYLGREPQLDTQRPGHFRNPEVPWSGASRLRESNP